MPPVQSVTFVACYFSPVQHTIAHKFSITTRRLSPCPLSHPVCSAWMIWLGVSRPGAPCSSLFARSTRKKGINTTCKGHEFKTVFSNGFTSPSNEKHTLQMRVVFQHYFSGGAMPHYHRSLNCPACTTKGPGNFVGPPICFSSTSSSQTSEKQSSCQQWTSLLLVSTETQRHFPWFLWLPRQIHFPYNCSMSWTFIRQPCIVNLALSLNYVASWTCLFINVLSSNAEYNTCTAGHTDHAALYTVTPRNTPVISSSSPYSRLSYCLFHLLLRLL